MKVLKGILIILGSLVLIALVLTLVAILCKAFNWLPNITDWINVNIFEKIGLTFFSKIGTK